VSPHYHQVCGFLAIVLLETVVVEVKANVEDIAGSVKAGVHHTH
jgi:hypothetical protein